MSSGPATSRGRVSSSSREGPAWKFYPRRGLPWTQLASLGDAMECGVLQLLCVQLRAAECVAISGASSEAITMAGTSSHGLNGEVLVQKGLKILSTAKCSCEVESN